MIYSFFMTEFTLSGGCHWDHHWSCMALKKVIPPNLSPDLHAGRHVCFSQWSPNSYRMTFSFASLFCLLFFFHGPSCFVPHFMFVFTFTSHSERKTLWEPNKFGSFLNWKVAGKEQEWMILVICLKIYRPPPNFEVNFPPLEYGLDIMIHTAKWKKWFIQLILWFQLYEVLWKAKL